MKGIKIEWIKPPKFSIGKRTFYKYLKDGNYLTIRKFLQDEVFKDCQHEVILEHGLLNINDKCFGLVLLIKETCYILRFPLFKNFKFNEYSTHPKNFKFDNNIDLSKFGLTLMKENVNHFPDKFSHYGVDIVSEKRYNDFLIEIFSKLKRFQIFVGNGNICSADMLELSYVTSMLLDGTIYDSWNIVDSLNHWDGIDIEIKDGLTLKMPHDALSQILSCKKYWEFKKEFYIEAKPDEFLYNYDKIIFKKN